MPSSAFMLLLLNFNIISLDKQPWNTCSKLSEKTPDKNSTYLNVELNVVQVNSENTRMMSVEEMQNNFGIKRTQLQYSVRIWGNKEQEKIRLTHLILLTIFFTPWKHKKAEV